MDEGDDDLNNDMQPGGVVMVEVGELSGKPLTFGWHLSRMVPISAKVSYGGWKLGYIQL